MLRRLKHWLLGYLTVHISGISPERFINLCSNRRIYIWNIIRENENYKFNLTVKNYKKLMPIFRKTRNCTKNREETWTSLFYHRYKKRKGFFLALLYV